MKLILLAIVFFSTTLSNCREEVQSSDIIKITFGTSFGMCFGYCTKVVTFENGSVTKELTSRDEDQLKKTCGDFYNTDELFSTVNVQAFLGLEETIGCPDCADGGAEWIEIITTEGSKKITYEYGKEPSAVKSFIGELRKFYDQLGECNSNN